MADLLETKCVTPEFRASYAHVWDKHTDSFGNEKFSIAMVFPEDADLSGVKKAIKNCMINEYGADQKKWGKDALKVRASIDELLMDGNIERPDDEVYADCKFMSAKSDNKIGVVEIVNGAVEPIMDQDEFYSGCYARAAIRFYIPKKFARMCCALDNVMKTADGDPLSGGSKAEDDFAEYADSSDGSSAADDSNWM